MTLPSSSATEALSDSFELTGAIEISLFDTDNKSSTDNLDSNTKATAKELIAEQLSDSSLSTCWALANKNKGGYFVKDGILFHKGIIAGQSCEQLCVPVRRRQSLHLYRGRRPGDHDLSNQSQQSRSSAIANDMSSAVAYVE